MKDWFSVKEFARRRGLSVSHARKTLEDMAKAGKLERKQVKESMGYKDTRYEQRPIVNYYRHREGA